MGLDNFIHIGETDMAIPHGVRIYDQVRTVFALIKAASFIRPHPVLETTLRQLRFEHPLQFTLPVWITTSPRMSFGPLVGADEKVLLELRHHSTVNEKGRPVPPWQFEVNQSLGYFPNRLQSPVARELGHGRDLTAL